MAKYLIQDIIPKERKHGASARAVGTHASTREERPSISHHAHPPINNEEGIRHTARHTKTHKPEVVMHGSSSETEVPMMDPRAILREEGGIEKHEDTHPHSVGHFEPIGQPSVYRDFNTQKFDSPSFSFSRTVSNTGNTMNSTFWGTWMPWIVGFSFVAFIAALVLNFFGGATVTVLPRTEEASMEKSITAFKLSAPVQSPHRLQQKLSSA